MMPFVVSMRTRYILGAGCDHSESCGSCSARERSSGATACGAAASSVVNAMKTDKRMNRVISRHPPALGSLPDDGGRYLPSDCWGGPFSPPCLSLHADHLAQRVYHVHQIALRFHHSVDGLVRHRRF